jgi:hypothetical protein
LHDSGAQPFGRRQDSEPLRRLAFQSQRLGDEAHVVQVIPRARKVALEAEKDGRARNSCGAGLDQWLGRDEAGGLKGGNLPLQERAPLRGH